MSPGLAHHASVGRIMAWTLAIHWHVLIGLDTSQVQHISPSGGNCPMSERFRLEADCHADATARRNAKL